ncbi:hypothetical protein U1Q18_029149 [Sarracenia purpurea var. burkii]
MLQPLSLTAGAMMPYTVAHGGSHYAVHRQTPNTGEIWNIAAEVTKLALPSSATPPETMEATPPETMEARSGETRVPVNVATTIVIPV